MTATSAPRPAAGTPVLSMVVVVYDMRREAPRTLESLSPGYQAGVAASDYEVIVVENGSSAKLDPEQVRACGENFSYHDLAAAPASPARALNTGVARSRGTYVGLMIDGARMVTPGLLRRALDGLRSCDEPLVGTLGFHLGSDLQNRSVGRGYDRSQEDRLLAGIDWPADGYRLFEIATFAGSSKRGWFEPPAESNCLFMGRRLFDRLGGFDEAFDLPGGGLVNHDFYRRATETAGTTLLCLLGEASFHQHHGGVATAPDETAAVELWERWCAQYARIRQRPYRAPRRRPILFGQAHPRSLAWLRLSGELAAAPARAVGGSGARPGAGAADAGAVAVRPGPVGDPLIVLGMHRSGTSALAGALPLLGVELGGPLMAPLDGENPRGYFEHLEIYGFHQRLLVALGVSWDNLCSPRLEPAGDPLFAERSAELAGILERCFAGTPLWAVKDPRTCRLVPLWDAAVAEVGSVPRYLVVFRHPDEVAASLARRDRFSRDKSDLLWADHYLAAEAATRGARRAFLSYAELLRAPQVELTRVAGELDLEWPAGDGAVASEELREFLSGRLRHHVAPGSELAPRGRLGAVVPRLWSALGAAAATGVLDEAACDSLRRELAEIQASFDPLLVEHFSQLAARSEIGRRALEHLWSLEEQLDEHTRWLEVQGDELEEQIGRRTRWLEVQGVELEAHREMLWSLEEQLGERTRWMKILDARIDELASLRQPESEDRNDEP